MRKQLEGDMAFDGGVVVELVYSLCKKREGPRKRDENETLRHTHNLSTGPVRSGKRMK